MLKSLYFKKLFFIATGVTITLFIVAYFLPSFIAFPKLISIILLILLIIDFIVLFSLRKGIDAARTSAERLSNGDDNPVQITIENFYRLPVKLNIIDEIPAQFQKRDLNYEVRILPNEIKKINYHLRPVKRGEYAFGTVNAFASSPLGFLSRRYKFSADRMVPVYPSYIQMRKYELMAISNKLTETGIKKIRRIGHNLEFELIKEYVPGDDYRTINWKATARRTSFMVNHYQDERSQQVYSLIDKGRVMQMPFNGMSLLDYAINASLVISNIAIKKSDKAGLVTFQDKIGTTLAATKRNRQMMQIMEVLYNQKTAYRESDFSVLYTHVRRKITQRSLLLLFTNFESIYGLHRQLPYIKSLSHQHLVVVIFFENTEVTKLIDQPATDLKEVYYKAVAEKFNFEKKLIVKELTKNGIQALLTSPEKLTVNTINKYLELKARGMI